MISILNIINNNVIYLLDMLLAIGIQLWFVSSSSDEFGN